MGSKVSKLFGNKEMRVLMLGLDNAGKTSITSKPVSPLKPALQLSCTN